MRKRPWEVDFVGQVIGLFIMLVGVGVTIAGLSLGSEFERPGAAVTRTGVHMTILGGIIIALIAFSPSLLRHCIVYTTLWWKSFFRWIGTLKRDSWQRFLGEDYSGRDVQMFQDGVLYRGRIERIEIFLPTRRRVSKIVSIICNKGHFVRDDDESDWQWVKLPLQVVIDYDRLNPIFESDGRVIFRGQFAGQHTSDQAVILDYSNTLPIPEEHEAETSGDDSASGGSV